jgi:endonuclease/exonuclease/phosphatase family metal-dependent hydrolase
MGPEVETKNGLEMSPDAAEFAFGEQRHGGHSWRNRALAVGITAVAALGVAWKYMEAPEGVEHIAPAVHKVAIIDNILKVGSWNMHGQAAERAGQIHKLASGLDALALQEVAHDDIAALKEEMPEYHIEYKVADKKQHVLDGGLGNAWLTIQKPKDVKSLVMKGTSLETTTTRTIAGVATDIIQGDTGLTSTRDGMQEDRAALAETIKVYNSGKLIDVRLITTHLSSHLDLSIHQRQLSQVLKFIKSNEKSGRPTVVMGDFNAGSREIVDAFSTVGLVSQDTPGTSVTSKRTIDHAGYFMAHILPLAKISVPHDLKTDHYPLLAEWSLSP